MPTIPAGARAALKGYNWLREDVITPHNIWPRESVISLQNIEKVKRLQPSPTELRCTMAQFAITWCLKPLRSTVITVASRSEQVTENMKAVEVVEKLDRDMMERTEEALETSAR